jgi:hypothetical protein
MIAARIPVLLVRADTHNTSFVANIVVNVADKARDKACDKDLTHLRH